MKEFLQWVEKVAERLPSLHEFDDVESALSEKREELSALDQSAQKLKLDIDAKRQALADMTVESAIADQKRLLQDLTEREQVIRASYKTQAEQVVNEEIKKKIKQVDEELQAKRDAVNEEVERAHVERNMLARDTVALRSEHASLTSKIEASKKQLDDLQKQLAGGAE